MFLITRRAIASNSQTTRKTPIMQITKLCQLNTVSLCCSSRKVENLEILNMDCGWAAQII